MDCPSNILEDVLHHFCRAGHGAHTRSVQKAISMSYRKGHLNIANRLIRGFDINHYCPLTPSPQEQPELSVFLDFINVGFHRNGDSRWRILDFFLSNGADVDMALLPQTKYVRASSIRWYNKNETNRALRPTILDYSFRLDRSLFTRLDQRSKVPKSTLTKTGVLLSLEKGAGALRDYLKTRVPAIDISNRRTMVSVLQFLLDDQLYSEDWGSCLGRRHEIDMQIVRNLFQYADDMNLHPIFLPKINKLLDRVIYRLPWYSAQFTGLGWELLDVLLHKGADIADRHLEFAVELEGTRILNWLRPRVTDFSSKASGALAHAVRLHNFQAVQFLVQSEVDPRASVDLSEAVQLTDFDVRYFHLQRRLDPNDQAKLVVAARQDNLKMVEFLVQSGVNPNNPVALALAARKNNFEVVEYLLQSGANPNAFISAKSAKLTIDEEYAFEQFTQRTVEQACSLQAIAAGIGTAASKALSYGRCSLRMFQFLAEKGAKLVIGPHDSTPFAFIMFLLETGLGDAELFAKVKFVLGTIKQSIHWASPPACLLELCVGSCRVATNCLEFKERIKIFEYLLDEGADVSLGSPLATLASFGAPKELVKRVLDLGAKLDAHTAFRTLWPSKQTPLQAAASVGNEDLIHLFLEQGANVNSPARGRCGWTALQAICGWDPATEKEHRRKMSICEILLNSGAEINAPASPQGITALQAALSSGDLELTAILIRDGADINGPPYVYALARKGCHYRLSVLDRAARSGRLDLAKLLLNANVVSGLRGITGYDGAINLAQYEGHHAVASLIRDHVGNGMQPGLDLLDFRTQQEDCQFHGHYTDCESTDDEYGDESRSDSGGVDNDCASMIEEPSEWDASEYDSPSVRDSLASPEPGDAPGCDFTEDGVDTQWDDQPVPDSFMGALTEMLDVEAVPDLQVAANAPTDDWITHSGTTFISSAEDIQMPGNEWMLRDPFEAAAGIPDVSALWQQVFGIQDEEFGFATFDANRQLPSSDPLGEPEIEGQDVAEQDFVY